MAWTMRTQLVTFSANTRGRDFAVGDVHGHFSILWRDLQALGFDTACDRLFAVGDLVDRGPESAQVPDWLDKPWFHAVRGNHEAMTLAALSGDEQAMRFHQANGGEWLQALEEPQRSRIGATLQALPLAMEVHTAHGAVGLVHADLPTDDWQDLRSSTLSARDASYCLWSVDRMAQQYAGEVRNIRAVVHGHITLPRMQVLGNVHFIDTHHSQLPPGQQGHFTFLELATLKAHCGQGPAWVKVPARYR
ncbi:MAG: metallophosphoesterase [Brachymonas sp.]|nr:metallophosphoesterase [Brachymonas sp.]